MLRKVTSGSFFSLRRTDCFSVHLVLRTETSSRGVIISGSGGRKLYTSRLVTAPAHTDYRGPQRLFSFAQRKSGAGTRCGHAARRARRVSCYRIFVYVAGDHGRGVPSRCYQNKSPIVVDAAVALELKAAYTPGGRQRHDNQKKP